jgi:RNA polymerase sigma-70 factor (ECF subfamily)
MRQAAKRPEAFDLVYRRHAKAVLSFLRMSTGSTELAADLTAEVFAAALIDAKRFKPRREPLRAWLFGIASHKAIDAHRRRGAERRARERLSMRTLTFSDDDYQRIDAQIDAERNGTPAEALLADLPAEQRDAVSRRVLDELSYTTIAAQLNITEAAARQRVSRGLARLGHELNKTESL